MSANGASASTMPTQRAEIMKQVERCMAASPEHEVPALDETHPACIELVALAERMDLPKEEWSVELDVYEHDPACWEELRSSGESTSCTRAMQQFELAGATCTVRGRAEGFRYLEYPLGTFQTVVEWSCSGTVALVCWMWGGGYPTLPATWSDLNRGFSGCGNRAPAPVGIYIPLGARVSFIGLLDALHGGLPPASVFVSQLFSGPLP